jgi:hypothetical protein
VQVRLIFENSSVFCTGGMGVCTETKVCNMQPPIDLIKLIRFPGVARLLRSVANLLLLAVATHAFAADTPERQWILVTAPEYRDALQPLCKQREHQNFKVVTLQTNDVLDKKEILAGDAEKLRKRVRELCREFKGTSTILLVGAVEPGKLEEPEKKVLPPLRGTTGRMKGQPSDNGYGCLDDGLEPSVAVGRFPARSIKEAEGMVKKTLAFENDDKPGEWRRRVTVIAGIPNFNPLADRLVENVAMARFDKLDPVWTGQAIFHSAGSRFTVPDDQLHDRAAKYVEAGQAFTLYLGHSGPEGLYAPKTKFLDRDDWAHFKITRGQGIFGTFGCNGCQLSGKDGEGYGIYAMRNPNGPVAVTGSHGICFAAMVQLAADGLFKNFAGTFPERLGDLWLGLKHGLAKGEMDPRAYNLLDEVDGDPEIPQATQRLEHLEMFVLLGDPALKLPAVQTDIKLKVTEARAGAKWKVQVELPERLVGSDVRLTLERTIASEPADLEPVPEKSDDARARAILANNERANRFVLTSKDVRGTEKKFDLEMEPPAKLPWKKLIVRAYAVKEQQEGIGVVTVEVKKP